RIVILDYIVLIGYFLLGQQIKYSLSHIKYTFIVYGTSSITLIIYNLILKNDFTGYTKSHWLIFLALAIFPTFFGHTIFNWALKWVSTSRISMAIVFETI